MELYFVDNIEVRRFCDKNTNFTGNEF